MRVVLTLFAFTSVAVQLRATEPVEVDVTQMTVAGNGGIIDYLVPVDHTVLQFYTVPQFYYLAQFIQLPSFSEGSYLVVLRSEDGRYLLRAGPAPNYARWDLASRLGAFENPPKTDTEVQIQESLAKVIYQIWFNALLGVHYHKGGGPMGFDGTEYVFSTYVRGGFMHGYTWSPSNDLPPTWMVNAGEKLLAFARDPKRDAQKTEAEMTALRDKLFRYLKTHGSR